MGEESLKNLDCVTISRNQESLKVNSMKSENGMIDLMLPVVIPADLNCKKRSTEICCCKDSSNDTFLELDAANNLDGFSALRGYKYERSLSNCSIESGDSYASAVSKLEPEADQEELHKMFKAFDENGDGAITLEELRNTMKKLGFELSEQELGVMVMSADKNGDGRVDFDEFLSLYSNLYAEDRKKDEERDVELLEAFQVFDKNSDGFISVQELHSVLSSLGLKEGTRLTDCQSMIRGVDSDGDGRVNFEEFKQMMNSSPFRQSY